MQKARITIEALKFYLTTGVTTSLKQLRLTADSAALATIPMCRESVSMPFSPAKGTAVNLLKPTGYVMH